MSRFLLAAATIALLAGCSQSQRPSIPDRVINRALQGAPGAAQPSDIVSAELSFARMAREKGQWTAFREFAGPGAIIHGRSGGIPAADWLASQSDPDEAVQWAPREIWMSCDGSLAVSTGRFLAPTGIVGNFVTVWQRQSDRTYKWVYDAAAADNPQPPPKVAEEEGDIIVTAIDALRGNVADCSNAGESRPNLPLENPARVSADGTLAYRWEHVGSGDRRFTSYWFNGGEWVPALEQLWPAQDSSTPE